ncbi:hypothetical protein P5W99_36255 [Paraburkholderia sp. A3BS-1L]|uniref:hypothetical protein n=1 Tax=Paraburkholderia sp. A3BS-1L TaxID=3028375 RepID=UPI003DA92FAD
MGKKIASLAVGEHRDLGDLTAGAPGARRGVFVGALAFDRRADRVCDALVKTIWKKHESASGQRM